MAKQSIQRVEKPWGYELIWGKTKDYVGKVLHVNKGHKLSLQYHKIKEETIYLASGKLNFVFENEAMNYGEQGSGDNLEQFIMVGADLFQVGVPLQPEHVFVDQPALQIVDVSDPSQPTLGAAIPATTS